MKKSLLLFAMIILLGWNRNAMAQAFSFTAGQLKYTESFDGMGPTGTSYLPGWNAIRYAGTGAVGEQLVLNVGDGSGNSGGIYNLGTTAATDRAFGSLGSGATVPRFGASFLNNTGSGITSIALTGIMEQWRSGSNNAVTEINAFEYSLDATDLTSGTWIAVTDFDLVEKIISSATAAALDGNLPENQTSITANIEGISWTAGSTLWIRWSDVNDGGSDGICAIDNLVMSVTTGTVTADPEPTNYPTDFAANAAGTSISTSWIDATGDQLPVAYLVKISKTNTISTPVDGIFEPDDMILTDGSGAKNVPFGQQAYLFSGLDEGTVYYLKIFPYTNGGTLVDYKTDGSIPKTSTLTQIIVLTSKFDADLLPWTQYSVTGTQIWTPDLTHGLNGSGCAKMSGFESNASFENEDWLISPAINLVHLTNTKFQFYSAYNYAGNPLSVLISTNYTSGDPTASGTWNDVSASAVFSPGGWVWTPSGYIGLGLSDIDNVHIAFKYTSTTTESRTWEIDEVTITGSPILGISDNSAASNVSRVFPNPCSGWFNAEMSTKGAYSIRISNAQGTVVKTIETDATTTKVETDSFASGLYFVTIINKKSGISEVHKLLVR